MPAAEKQLLSNVMFMGIEIPLAVIEPLFHILDINLANLQIVVPGDLCNHRVSSSGHSSTHTLCHASTTPRPLRLMIFLVLVKSFAALLSNHSAKIILIDMDPGVGRLLLVFAGFVLLPNLLLAKLIVTF